jgi:hypothetical protein
MTRDPMTEDWVARASAMLDAAGLYKIPVREMVPVLEGLLDVITDLRIDADELERVNARMSTLLSQVAMALKGPEAPLTLHSWHDLPELAAALKRAEPVWPD